jgi:hypothetical protein
MKDINGVKIGVRKNNVVTIHGPRKEDRPNSFFSLKGSGLKKGDIGVVTGWGCAQIETGCSLRKLKDRYNYLDYAHRIFYTGKSLEVIGTL